MKMNSLDMNREYRYDIVCEHGKTNKPSVSSNVTSNPNGRKRTSDIYFCGGDCTCCGLAIDILLCPLRFVTGKL